MVHSRRLRFGVQQYHAASSQEWAEIARRVEALGYDTLVIPDHIGQGLLAYAPALMAAADATTTLRIGTLVLDNDFRHPAVVASEAATLDVLSNGRFELGIGAGWDRSDYEVSGIPFDSARVRVDRFEESVQTIKRLFENGSASFAGKHYAIDELQNYPPPVQRPHPPMLIGASGPRMLTIAAREANIVSIMPPGLGSRKPPDMTADAMARSVKHVRMTAGDRFNQLQLSTLLQRLVVTDDRELAAQELARQWVMPVQDALETPWALIGTIGHIVDTLRERRERFGLSYWVVQSDHMETFAPVVARLASN